MVASSKDLKKRLDALESKVKAATTDFKAAGLSALRASLQPHQLKFLDDASQFKTAVCGRQAGKTFVDGAMLLAVALTSKCVCLYIDRNRKEAKEKFWRPVLLEMNKRLNLGGVANETECYLRLPNGSYIYLIGANDEQRIEGIRGHVLKLVVLDEAQNITGRLPNLIDQILVPALWKEKGTLVLTGTPGPVPQGYFYEQSKSAAWSHHHFTFKDNKHIPATVLKDEMKRRGVTEDDPFIQREFHGRWVLDSDSLVFHYDKDKNTFENRPASQKWTYVIGVDLGYDDSDAIAVFGWTPTDTHVYLVEEFVANKQLISELGERLVEMNTRFKPREIVIDTGALGKKITMELNDRYKLRLVKAEKSEKLAHIELLNDALRTGMLKVKPYSRFAADCGMVEWDKTNPESPKISDRFHSDIMDAALYAFRSCTHWRDHKPQVIQPIPGTAEYGKHEEQRMWNVVEKQIQEKQREDAGVLPFPELP